MNKSVHGAWKNVKSKTKKEGEHLKVWGYIRQI